MAVRWYHLSTDDCHLVRLSNNNCFWICLYGSLSVSSAGLSRRIRSRSSSCDLADDGTVESIECGWPYPLQS